ncbi:folylpolyglutamate synthase [Wickerhamomyces ciferrii]|uniref:Dihydrofolate synthetase n=1 Tax=Wickerhamomyces ciferrii (strain ATCC 14091 / BCRC 22168 / CBS 111 / JCM 3599 / NBRC 0793 / NRRL Y-1031 F-60-10) TaxID=1206466 RepID=K0KG06_WICCF|nr:folylpolyglutamate synthase [Wickerhamomyces ciferrii]CCH41142.1 folylpolyglutamate synthase [Wickerhamomyces ciferrii]
MPIELGLNKISSLLTKLGNPQLKSNFIHIAGTNGKGSVCAYLSSILVSNTINNFKIGKFTSPHLLDRNDCITLDNVPVPMDKFLEIEKQILEINSKFQIGATEFEILTAIAFQVFKLEKVDLAVLEVGLGGRLDSTNIVSNADIDDDLKIIKKGVLITGITKIGMDHENILGSTLKEIANEKAGIIKALTPNVIDGTNHKDVLEVIRDKCDEFETRSFEVNPKSNEIQTNWGIIDRNISPLQGDYQLQNLSISLKILDLLFPFLYKNYPNFLQFNHENIIKGIKNVQWAGRLQTIYLQYTPKEHPVRVLLDGAHNGQSAEQLGAFLDSKYGKDSSKTFIIAVTKGKDLKSLSCPLIKPQDKVIFTKFGPVDQMPWIQANDPNNLKEQISDITQNVIIEPEIAKTFKHAEPGNEIVVCGSLYLVAEVLRLHRGDFNK